VNDRKSRAWWVLAPVVFGGILLAASKGKEEMQEGREHEKEVRLFRAAQSYARALDADDNSRMRGRR
jgi:hypothetical protein